MLKILFYLSVVFILMIAGVSAGYAARFKIGYYIGKGIEVYEDLFTNPLVFPGVADTPPGLTRYGDFVDDGFLLISAYFMDDEEVEIRLVELATGRTMNMWRPDPAEIRKQSKYSRTGGLNRFQPQHPYLMPDGGLVFNDFGLLARVDACANIMWILEKNLHHSIETDLDGNFLAPALIHGADLEQTPRYFKNDALARLSPDGEHLASTSVAKILVSNGCYGLFEIAYHETDDTVHLNDIEVARKSVGIWQEGDLLISMRTLNTVFVYRPETGKIVWLKTGPWTKQHDPDFLPNGDISIFGNNYMYANGEYSFIGGSNSIYVVNPLTDTITTPYDTILRRETVATPSQGRHRILENGDAFVEETDRGRLFRISPDAVRWSYNNSDGSVAGALNWSRYVTRQEYAAVDLSAQCDAAQAQK